MIVYDAKSNRSRIPSLCDKLAYGKSVSSRGGERDSNISGRNWFWSTICGNEGNKVSSSAS